MRTFVLGFFSGIVFLFLNSHLTLYFLIPFVLIFNFPILKNRLLYYFIYGLILGSFYSYFIAQSHLNNRFKENPQDKIVSGFVLQKPQKTNYGLRFLIEPEDKTLPSKISVNWYFNQKNPPQNLNAGDFVQLNLRLKQIHGFYNEGGFDYERKMLIENIGATAYVKNILKIEKNKKNNFLMNIERLRFKIEKTFLNLLPKEQYPYVGILIALSIGEQNAITQNEWQLFNQTAVTHLFSISGLHITFLSTFFAFLFSLIWKQFPTCVHWIPVPIFFAIQAAIFAFFYALLAGFGIPAQRTLYMLLTVAIAIILRRQIAPSQILFCALLVVLIYSPFSIFAIGFWLSFGTVSILTFIGYSYIQKPAKNKKEKMINMIQIFCRTQWASALFTLPILLYVFSFFPFVSPLSNALAIPLVSMLITPLVLFGTLFLFLNENFALFLLKIAHFLIDILMQFLNILINFPFFQNSIPLYLVVFGLLGVFILQMPRGFYGRSLGIFFIIPLFFYQNPRPKQNEAWIDFLDVGQGLSVLIRTHHHNLLFDAGPKYHSDSNAAKRVIIPFLKNKHIQHLDYVILSHADYDHIGGFEDLKNNIPINRIFSSFGDFDSCHHQQESFQLDGVDFQFFSTVNFEKDLNFEKNLASTVENNQNNNKKNNKNKNKYKIRNDKKNNLSCVLKITANGKSLLLTADIPIETEKMLLDIYSTKLKSDIIQLAHHGSKFSNSILFLKEVGAKNAVASSGFQNKYQHPDKIILKRLEKENIQLWRTDLMGQIHIVLNQEDLKINALRQKQKRFWFDF